MTFDVIFFATSINASSLYRLACLSSNIPLYIEHACCAVIPNRYSALSILPPIPASNLVSKSTASHLYSVNSSIRLRCSFVYGLQLVIQIMVMQMQLYL